MKRNRHLHPSPRKLERWVNGTEPSLDLHIENCHRCANRLEEVFEPGSTPIKAALSQLSRPPSDLTLRLTQGIGLKMQQRADIELAGELIGVSWQTVRVLSRGTEFE